MSTLGKITKGLVGAVAVGAVGAGIYSMSKRHTSSSTTSSSSSSDSSPTSTASSSTGTSSSASATSSGDGNLTKKTVVEEVPITNYDEAYDFASREWHKIKRDNGRELDCQTIGSGNWINGEWCRVYMPSFDIDGYMYIIRVSQTADDGDWTCNLSLVDYPPGWGKEEIKEESEDEGEESEDDLEEVSEDT